MTIKNDKWNRRFEQRIWKKPAKWDLVRHDFTAKSASYDFVNVDTVNVDRFHPQNKYLDSESKSDPCSESDIVSPDSWTCRIELS